MTQSATEKYSKQEHKLTDHTGWWIAAWVKVDIWSHLHTITYICSVCNVCPKDDMSLPWQWILPWWYWRWYSQSLAHLGPRLSAPRVCDRLEMEIKSVVSCLKKSLQEVLEQLNWRVFIDKNEWFSYKAECSCIGSCFCSLVSGPLCDCRATCTLVAVRSE